MQNKFEEKLTKEEIESKKKEDWLKFLRVRYDFPEDFDIIRKSNLKKLKYKKYFSGFMTGIFILLGLSLIAGSIFYGTYYDKFKSEIICGNSTLTCGDTACPEINIPDCNCPDCNCNFPDEIQINLKNETT